ncbi:MAG: SH3 domain-containing protein [Oceanospirillaceae bacterium]
MIKYIISISLSAVFALTSTSLLAENLFSNLKINEVQKIFDDADKSKLAVYLTNSSSKGIPSVQILPQVNNARNVIHAGASCIKLYSCNQGICLVEFDNKKYATSETVLNKLTQKQTTSYNCNAILGTASQQQASKVVSATQKSDIPFSWVKVVKVKNNDTLNVRQKTNYKSKKMGAIAFNTSCIKRYSCTGKWCKIAYQKVSGWVHKSYIQKLDSNQAQQCL